MAERGRMRLDELPLPDIPAGARSIEINALAYDSRQVRPGALFFCVPGFSSDGHDFAERAITAGARALVLERALELDVPEIVVPSARRAMGPVAAAFFGHPSRDLRVVGVTGTNGKTTTAFLVRSLLEANGEQCGLLGTVKSIVAGVERQATRTTAEAIDLQADLCSMLTGGDRACAMEVSSHALELGRTDEVSFAAAIFTNLTQDHLDFHPTMEDYFHAKRRLFIADREAPAPASSIINLDDSYGRRLANEVPGAVSFALEHEADYRASAIEMRPHGWRFDLQANGQGHRVELPLPGRFNISNALGAIAAAHSLGHELERVIAALEDGVHVPGRFEPVREGQDFTVLVDYAHTPDSLENVLASARELTRADGSATGRLVCVFGAGGDRDRSKRPMMGRVAAQTADVVIVTSDNPRSENPETIINQIMDGARRSDRPAGAGSLLAIPDRREAIEHAIDVANSEDVIVIAGKGHEQGQEFAGGVKIPFDDVSVVREILRMQRRTRPGTAA